MEMITIYREIKDPRREHLKEHGFECIFYIAVAAVIGGESWYDVSDFGKCHEDFSVQESPASRVSLLMTRSTASSLCCPLTNLKKDSAVG